MASLALRAPVALPSQRHDEPVRAVIRLPARFDAHQVDRFERQVGSLDLGPGDSLSLDGSAVLHADRRALGALDGAFGSAFARGADVRLVDASLALRLAIEFEERARPARRAREGVDRHAVGPVVVPDVGPVAGRAI